MVNTFNEQESNVICVLF